MVSARHEIKLTEAAFRLRIGRSRIDRFGVFAAESIPTNRKVIEYTGERVSKRLANKRWQKTCAGHKRLRAYTFTLNRYWVIDGARGGSGAEIINHCCDPNLKARKIRDHIVYWSCRNIHRGEELTVDYRYRWRKTLTPCHCGSPKCRGTINLKRRVKRKS